MSPLARAQPSLTSGNCDLNPLCLAGGTGWEADDRRRKWAGMASAVPAFSKRGATLTANTEFKRIGDQSRSH